MRKGIKSVSIQKRQHFVSAVYLRRFCDEDGNLRILDIEKQEMRTAIPENVAIKKHLYTVVHDGNKDVRIEEFLGDIETHYSEHIRKIEKGLFGELSQADLVEILWFISFLYARNLSKVTRFSEIANGLMSHVGKSLLDHNLRETSQEHLRPFLQIKPNQDYIHKMAMLMMFRFAKGMYDSLTSEGEWFFCVSPAGAEFVTTDDPMDNMVMLPLSKNVFFMRITEDIPGIDKNQRLLSVTPQWVADINQKIAATAKRYLYASNNTLLEQHKIDIERNA
jgi:hypothetical protein